MEMAITPAVSAAPKGNTSNASVDATNASQSGNSQFKQTLSASMNGQSQTSGTTSTDSTTATATAQTASTEMTGQTPLTADQLLAAIGELIASLQSEDLANAPELPVVKDQLQDMMDQLNAMLSLLGVQSVPAMPIYADNVTDALKADVQQALVQLQDVINKGQLGTAQLGNALQWIGEQVKGLQQAVQQLKVNVKTSATDAAGAQQQDDFVVEDQPQAAKSQPVVQAQAPVATSNKAVTFLEQLNRQSVNPHVLQALASQQTEQETVDQQPATEQAANTVFPNIQTTESARAAVAIRQVTGLAHVPAQQFAETMANLMVDKFEVKTVGGISEAKLTLTPEHLGQVDVRISVQNGQLTALFVTDSSASKELLDNQLAQLRANLQSQGLNVEKLEVSQQSVNTQMSQQQHGNGNGQQQSNGNGPSGDGDSEEAAFESELAQQTVIRGLGYGRAINVKA
ncbi:Flagellar hook-length control protein-like, C-terminal domain [Paenibacillus curdlanolyticus YK9]|uniref:Flagellar hook-length control protein-like, C-terminal domain n=1 Tax=Paenibacillus curdlanolyticus YK9 TaxID=717606 RepID=E0I446_9BACL|nr:flagellar hook-length control protein FliK [Paenibacillus curdlanolyticus]EFM13060.1 Flagellar hook-length control protein-like, C-terminal domain [Paenibacillus curdlanolyticus YK9]